MKNIQNINPDKVVFLFCLFCLGFLIFIGH